MSFPKCEWNEGQAILIYLPMHMRRQQILRLFIPFCECFHQLRTLAIMRCLSVLSVSYAVADLRKGSSCWLQTSVAVCGYGHPLPAHML